MQVEPAQRKEREARGKKAPPYLADGLILLPWYVCSPNIYHIAALSHLF